MKFTRAFVSTFVGLLLTTLAAQADSIFVNAQPSGLAPGGGELVIEMQIEYPAVPQAMGIELALPEGWIFSGLEGRNRPQIVSPPGSTEKVEMAWMSSPADGAQVAVKLAYPAHSSAAGLAGNLEIRRDGEVVEIAIKVPLDE